MTPRSLPPRALAACVAALGLAAAGCAATKAGGPGAGGPAEVRRALLGRNVGLTSVRATVEARFSYAGREVSLPGVLLLQRLNGFRLDLLDPLDRPVAVFYAEEGRIVQYRPADRVAATLGTFPKGCKGVGPGDWVAAVIAGSDALAAGEQDRVRAFFGRSLERSRDGDLRQSIRYGGSEGDLRPSIVSWYCDEETVMQMKVRGWGADPQWRLPSRIDLAYPKAALSIRIDVKEAEGNPPPMAQPFFPRIPADTRWSVWDLPQ